MMKNILCKIGLHRPLNVKKGYLFKDTVSGKFIKAATCPCGRKWLTDGEKWGGFKTISPENA